VYFNSPLWVGLVLTALLVGLIVFKVRPMIVFSLTSGVLFLSGSVTQEVFLSGFINSALVTLLLLIICSFAIEKTTLIKSFGQQFFGKNKIINLIKLCVSCSIASGFTNNTAVVSTVMASINQNKKLIPSHLLLPLSYACIVGGTLTLVGTSTNLIVAGFVETAGLNPFSMFSTTPIAVFVLIASLAVMIPTAYYLLPTNKPDILENNEYFIEAKVGANSSLINKTVLENGFRNLDALFLAEVIRNDKLISPVDPNFQIQANDKLMFAGDVKNLTTLNKFDGLKVLNDDLASINNNLVQVVITADARISGKTIKQSNFRSLFNATVVGVRRGGQKVTGGLGKVKLKPGDALLLAVGKDFKNRNNLKKNFIVLNEELGSGQLSSGLSKLVIAGFVLALGVAAVGAISLLKSLLVLLGFYLAVGALSIAEVRRRLPFEIVIIVGSAITVAHAMQSSGLAAYISEIILVISSDYDVFGAFVVLFITTVLLTELITNNAAAALVFPIGLTLANHFNADPMPFIMAVAFGASASFLSPFGYQTNLMVYSAGQYQIKDYFKFGLPVSLVYSVTAIYVIPKVYGF